MTERELNDRLAALERERAEEIAKTHAALAAAQDRSYWLDRWHVDLNAVMRKPGAGLVRAAFRALRAVYRLAYDARSRTGKAIQATEAKVAGARERLEREAPAADADAPAVARLPFERLRVTPVSDALRRASANGAVDRDDPRALAALTRADAVVGALAHTGLQPRAGQVWLGVGPTADDVLRLVGAAYADLTCRAQTLGDGEGADAAFAISGWIAEDAALARLRTLHGAVKVGGSLVVGAEGGAQAVVTPAWIAARATPEWRVALYLPGGLEGDRDLYVLERA